MNGPTIRWVRHAESQANAGEKTSLPEEITLTARGRADALRFAAEWKERPDLIVVSKYLRAEETAAPLSERFPDTRTVCLPVHEFTFLCPARCRQTSFADRQTMVEEFWQRGDPSFVDGQGAESFMHFCGRIRDSVASMLESSCQRILVVSHAQAIQIARAGAAAESFDAISMADFRKLCQSQPIANLELVRTHGY
jgi:2,3-bisphosphoglycerate-dependent phosphoglycerate mutase